MVLATADESFAALLSAPTTTTTIERNRCGGFGTSNIITAYNNITRGITTMARERTAAPMAGFFKFTKVGQSVAGHVHDYRTIPTVDGKSTFVIMRPILINDGTKRENGAKWLRWESAAIGLSTDLRLKITEKDKGAFLRITFSDKEPSRKGNPRKIFVVEELEPSEIRALDATADKTNQQEPYHSGDEKSADNDDDSDEIPF